MFTPDRVTAALNGTSAERYDRSGRSVTRSPSASARAVGVSIVCRSCSADGRFGAAITEHCTGGRYERDVLERRTDYRAAIPSAPKLTVVDVMDQRSLAGIARRRRSGNT